MPVLTGVAPAEPIGHEKRRSPCYIGRHRSKGNGPYRGFQCRKCSTTALPGSKARMRLTRPHGGYDPTYANTDPNRVLPIDVLREMEKEGEFKKLYDYFFTTVGNGTPVANAKKFGSEIGARLKKDGVDAVILTST